MRKKNEIHIQGYPICPGIAIGRPFHFTVAEENVPEFSVPDDKIEHEIDRYYSALKSSQKDLLFLQKRMQKEGGNEAAAILGSHLEIMRDPFMTVQMEEAIRTKGKNTEYVFKTVIGEYEQKFQKITDVFFESGSKISKTSLAASLATCVNMSGGPSPSLPIALLCSHMSSLLPILLRLTPM